MMRRSATTGCRAQCSRLAPRVGRHSRSECPTLSGSPRRPRRGISILEVLAAFVIFFISFVALSELVNLGIRQAALVQQRELAALMCQTKLAEVVAGAIPLSSQESSVEEAPEWTWSLQCEQHGQLTGLWNVRVSVSRTLEDGNKVESILTQMVLDPSIRGSTMDSTTIAGTESTETGSSTGGGSSSSGGGATTTGGSR